MAKTLIIALILFAAFSVRALNLDKGFSGDEMITMEIARLQLDKIMPAVASTDAYPPLTYMLLHQWMSIINSEIWVRLYFVFFGIGVCFMIFLLAREYLGENIARLALLLSAFSPLLIFASQYARSYIDSAFWILLSTFFILKLIKGDERPLNWIGYVLSVALSGYTFYFSALVIFPQILFAAFYKINDKKFILKLCAASLAVFMIFSPWLGTACKQFGSMSSLAYNVSDKGFNIGVLRLGLYIRIILAAAGFDPHFLLFPGGVTGHFPGTILAAGAAAGLFVLIFLFIQCFRYMKARLPPKDSNLAWFFIFLIFIPILIACLLTVFLGILPNAKYFASLNAFFIIVISALIYGIFEKSRIAGVLVTILLIAVYMTRIPQAVSPDFDTKNAVAFLKANLTKNDPLVCLRSGPGGQDSFRTIFIGQYFRLNDKRSNYAITTPEAWEEIGRAIQPFGHIWFYKAYGSIEAFGGNSIFEEWLYGRGYRVIKVTRFNNIDIVEYEK